MSLLVSRPGVYLLLSISLLLSPGSLQAEDRRLDIAWETFQFMTSMPPASELEGKFAQYVYRLDGKRSGTKFLLDNLGEFSGAAALEIIL
ncbi:MAG: hypothetical protein HOE54_06980, partial [Gammaproteobacteria bacterium]|nr:hypothetical protein [Gammaproteobacteria bacterium]